jgi:predicted ribonuclease YlaK
MLVATKAKGTAERQEAPTTLKGHMFYGLKLDEQQEAFRDAIWSKEVDIVACTSKAGSGKTLIAIATASLMVRYGLYSKIVYITNPVMENKLGFMPGSEFEKTAPYAMPLKDALIRCNYSPDAVIDNANPDGAKNGTTFVHFESSVFLRGCNLDDAVMIVDEAQNCDRMTLRKILTRACQKTKVVMIGNPPQCDLAHPDASGFLPCLEHFRDKNDARFMEVALTKNYRSWVADVADEAW